MPSSVILGMIYEPETRILEIVFRDGRVTYRYFDVPTEEWVAFYASASKGTYLNHVFKPKNYRLEKVEHSGRGPRRPAPRRGGETLNAVPLTWGFHRE